MDASALVIKGLYELAHLARTHLALKLLKLALEALVGVDTDSSVLHILYNDVQTAIKVIANVADLLVEKVHHHHGG